MNISKQSLIDEPNAAFISYIHDSEDSESIAISPHYNSKVLVFDFGGGTCDISILEIGKSANGLYSKNVAISKFTKLGGDDIDRYITYKLYKCHDSLKRTMSLRMTSERKNDNILLCSFIKFRSA